MRFLSDLRLALRGFRRHPMLFLGASTTLALGVLAAVALGTAFYRVLLKPLPYAHPDRLLALSDVLPAGDFGLMSYQDYSAIKEHASHLEGMGASRMPRGPLALEDRRRDLRSLSVSSGWMEALGVRPALGETFRPEHENGRFVMLGHDLWRREFQGDRAIIGRQLHVNGQRMLVLGILPQGFTTPGGWAPDLLVSLDPAEARNFGLCLQVVARVAPGSAPRAVLGDLEDLARRLGAAGVTIPGMSLRVQSLAAFLHAGRSIPLIALLGGGLLLLLTACANVAGLFLARTLEQGSDTCVRLALGARFRHLLRFHVAEGLLVGLAGGTLGLVGAWFAVRSMVRWLPVDLGRATKDPQGLEGLVLLVSAVLVLAVSLWVALVPALHGFRQDLGQVLRNSGGGASPSGRSWSFLLVGQVAISTLLVACAGLSIRSLLANQRTELGFLPRDLYQISLNLPDGVYSSARFTAARREAIQSLEAMPGVASVATTVQPVFKGSRDHAALLPADQDIRTAPLDAWIPAVLDTVDGAYLRTLQIALKDGRDFGPGEVPGGPRAVLVNPAFARRWGGGPILGRTFRAAWGTSPEEALTSQYQVVGVLADARLESPLAESVPRALMSANQLAWQGTPTHFLLRMNPGKRPPWAAIQAALRRAAPEGTLGPPESISHLGRGHLEPGSLQARLAGAFAGLSLLLSAASIFVALSAHAARKRRDAAIRAALGATFLQQCRVLLGPALIQVGAGIALGLALVVALGKVLHSLYQGVAPLDPVALAAGVAAILAATFLACLRPALRVGRMEPADILNK